MNKPQTDNGLNGFIQQPVPWHIVDVACLLYIGCLEMFKAITMGTKCTTLAHKTYSYNVGTVHRGVVKGKSEK